MNSLLLVSKVNLLSFLFLDFERISLFSLSIFSLIFKFKISSTFSFSILYVSSFLFNLKSTFSEIDKSKLLLSLYSFNNSKSIFCPSLFSVYIYNYL